MSKMWENNKTMKMITITKKIIIETEKMDLDTEKQQPPNNGNIKTLTKAITQGKRIAENNKRQQIIKECGKHMQRGINVKVYARS